MTTTVKLSPEAARFVDDRVMAGEGADPDAYVNALVLEKAQQARDYERWFRNKVMEGVAAADRGEFATETEIAAALSRRG